MAVVYGCPGVLWEIGHQAGSWHKLFLYSCGVVGCSSVKRSAKQCSDNQRVINASRVRVRSIVGR